MDHCPIEDLLNKSISVPWICPRKKFKSNSTLNPISKEFIPCLIKFSCCGRCCYGYEFRLCLSQILQIRPCYQINPNFLMILACILNPIFTTSKFAQIHKGVPDRIWWRIMKHKWIIEGARRTFLWSQHCPNNFHHYPSLMHWINTPLGLEEPFFSLWEWTPCLGLF